MFTYTVNMHIVYEAYLFQATIYLDFGCCFCHLLLHSTIYMKSVETCINLPLWLDQAYIRWNAWSDERRSSYCIAARSIVRSFSLSCDPIALYYNTCFHCKTVAYWRRLNRKIQCVVIVLNMTFHNTPHQRRKVRQSVSMCEMFPLDMTPFPCHRRFDFEPVTLNWLKVYHSNPLIEVTLNIYYSTFLYC